MAARFAAMPRKTAPAKDVPDADSSDAQWITPKLVGEVRYSDWTRTGKLRHPSWRGWRPDKTPADVRREAPAAAD
jgi:bifunctional non-homologous end joining protein LigD